MFSVIRNKSRDIKTVFGGAERRKSAKLQSKLRNETAKRRFRDGVSRRRMFRNFEHVWNAFYYMQPVVVAMAMVLGGS